MFTNSLKVLHVYNIYVNRTESLLCWPYYYANFLLFFDQSRTEFAFSLKNSSLFHIHLYESFTINTPYILLT